MLVAVLDVGSNTVRLLVAEVGRERRARAGDERQGVPRPRRRDRVHRVARRRVRRRGGGRLPAVRRPGAGRGQRARRGDRDRARPPGRGRSGARRRAPGRHAPARCGSSRPTTRAGSPSTAPSRAPRRFRSRSAWSTSAAARPRSSSGNRRSGARWVGSVGSRLAPPDATRPARRPAVEAGARGCARDGPERALAALAAAPGGRARGGRERPGAREARRPRTFDAEAAETVIARLARRRSTKVARAAGIDERRAETLLGGALLLAESSRVLGRPLTLARGGLREGAALALAREGAAAAA